MELIDLVYLDAECLKFLPSEIAASALCVVVRNGKLFYLKKKKKEREKEMSLCCIKLSIIL